VLGELSVSLRRMTTRPRPFPSHGSILPLEPGSLSNFGLSRSLNFIGLVRERAHDPTPQLSRRAPGIYRRHPSSRRSGRSHGSPPPHVGRNNAGINHAARGVFAAPPGRGPRRGTAPEGKPARLRWTEVTLPVLRPRSTPLGKLDPVIRLFEGNFLGRLSNFAQVSRISRRLAWPRSRWLDTSLYRRPTARVQPVPPPFGRAAPRSPPEKNRVRSASPW
jgi:hypothetical protein